MTPDTEAASPASSAPKGNFGDGKKDTAANVSEAEAIKRFAQSDAKRLSNAAPATDTSAEEPAKPATSDSSDPVSSSAAEPAQSGEPQADSPTTSVAEAPQAETPEAKGEEAEGDVLSPESSLDQKTKERIQKRIDKEVAKRKAQEAKTQTLESELQQLKSQVAQLQQPKEQESAAAPEPDAPLPDIKDAKGLAEYKQMAKQTVRWAEELLDRDDVDQGVTVEGKTYTKAEIKGIMRNARAALEDVIPAQQEYFQQQAIRQQQSHAITQQAIAAFPFLAEPNNEDVKAAETFFRQNLPSVVKTPAYKWLLGAYVNGVRPVVEAQKQAAKPKAEPVKEAPKPAPAPKPKAPSDQAAVSATGSVPRMNPDALAKSAVQAEYDRFRSKGNASTNDAAAMLARLDAAKRR